ncbi:alpha/beta hydrolase [Orenia marismortui]|uniref:Esterase/lipase n=1 Tax=Orenia marismortui TaxID=46469 RepID=A0A4R8GT93_9FIRM|nr:alpha/beta fold hydrolase [Orenia marismortui]TDX48038.1 esterase/lipase [Orenia marismortui]
MGDVDVKEYAQPFFFKGNDEACLLIHGFTGSAGHMRYLGEFLNQEGGYTISAPLLPGHGTSVEDMEKRDWQEWIDYVKKEYKQLKEEYNKVYVMGLSMGGIISLILAEEYNVGKVIPIAAPIKIYSKLAYLTPVLKYFKRFKGSKAEILQSDQDDYDVYYGATPISTVPSLLKLMKIARKNLTKITVPTLIIQSKNDRTVKPISAEIIYKNISSQDKDILWLDNAGHVCTISDEKEIIHQQVLSFLSND